MIQKPFYTIASSWIDPLVDQLAEAKVTVFGDLCLDSYWLLKSDHEEISIETGLPVHRVSAQVYSLGGAGNVAANIRSLGVENVELIGCIGNDMFAGELSRQLALWKLNLNGLVKGPNNWNTAVYIKPYLEHKELNRFDINSEHMLPQQTLEQLIHKLEKAAAKSAVVVINQQVKQMWSDHLIKAINRVVKKYPETLFIADSRNFAAEFENVGLKLNLEEAAKFLQTDADKLHAEDCTSMAQTIEQRINKPVILTRGEHGLVLVANKEVFDVPGIELGGEVDPVGAGDTTIATFAACMAVKAEPMQSAVLANIAAAITTRQLMTTGMATGKKIKAVGVVPNYIYSPRLAAQPRLAQYLENSDIEQVTGRIPSGKFRHAIFDHDGTISTLRQGWETIMEPMMLEAIIGDSIHTISDDIFEMIRSKVKTFIDRTTGIQTLAQMKGLVDLVRELAYIDPEKILDEHGYKAVYNKKLLELVATRREKLLLHELDPEDWQIKKAPHFLHRLRESGISLYLASGTDQEDVIDEANFLGYGSLFDGGIFGAVGDLKIEAKREVISRILLKTGSNPEELIIFGDGPVEIREGRRRGAFTVGVASDEVRGHGIDLKKRTRLIRAGADIIIPDFSQLERLSTLLGLQSNVSISEHK